MTPWLGLLLLSLAAHVCNVGCLQEPLGAPAFRQRMPKSYAKTRRLHAQRPGLFHRPTGTKKHQTSSTLQDLLHVHSPPRPQGQLKVSNSEMSESLQDKVKSAPPYRSRNAPQAQESVQQAVDSAATNTRGLIKPRMPRVDSGQRDAWKLLKGIISMPNQAKRNHQARPRVRRGIEKNVGPYAQQQLKGGCLFNSKCLSSRKRRNYGRTLPQIQRRKQLLANRREKEVRRNRMRELIALCYPSRRASDFASFQRADIKNCLRRMNARSNVHLRKPKKGRRPRPLPLAKIYPQLNLNEESDKKPVQDP